MNLNKLFLISSLVILSTQADTRREFEEYYIRACKRQITRDEVEEDEEKAPKKNIASNKKSSPGETNKSSEAKKEEVAKNEGEKTKEEIALEEKEAVKQKVLANIERSKKRLKRTKFRRRYRWNP